MHYTLRRPVVSLADPAYGQLPPDLLVSFRVANPMIGLGLLESIMPTTLHALADPDDVDGDGISGRVNIVWDAGSKSPGEGRFGWKANAPSLVHQNAGAALGDMGITTPVHPQDHCVAGQDACAAAAAKVASGDEPEMAFKPLLDMTVFTRLLAVSPQRDPDAPLVKRGWTAFRPIGCAHCHMPTLTTGRAGEGLADGRPDYLASGAEWRTTPLWGLGLTQAVSGHTFLLHDGRARDIAEAILWHGGEAEAVRERFRALPAAGRADLLAFLNSL